MTRAASVLVAILLSSALASAQEAPATRPSADEYTRRVRRGIEQLAGGDGAGAIATLREAAALDGSRPEAAYYTGTAHRMSGSLEQALTSFQQGRRARAGGEPAALAREGAARGGRHARAHGRAHRGGARRVAGSTPASPTRTRPSPTPSSAEPASPPSI
ncbi:MAG: hypothetical protein M5U28_23655 [Sandaracinaceae bacterium]|nr:hypothetical protein [Sandaracinaceae bacterium]